MPGRFQVRKVSKGGQPSAKRLPSKPPLDLSRVAANRKPISWRPTPVQTSARPENAKPRNKVPVRRFRPKRVVEEKSKDEAALQEEPPAIVETAAEPGQQEETTSQASQEEWQGSQVSLATLDLPPVNLSIDGDSDRGAFDTHRSIGMESMPETRQKDGFHSLDHDSGRPRTAGTKNKSSRTSTRRKRIGSRKTSSLKKSSESINSAPEITGGKVASTSEVWVPEENKLYVYTYSSQPRLLHVRKMAAGRVATTSQYDQDPNSSFRLKIRGNGNPMYDRRVVRGSNYGKRSDGDELPKWNPYFANARSLTQNEHALADSAGPMQLRRQEFRQKLEARARMRRENHGMSSLYSSNAGHYAPRSYARSNAVCQTENVYEPLERPPETEAGVQTDPWTESGSPPPVIAQNPSGVDAATQVFDTELDADDEDGAVLAALVGRTMKEAILEVALEEQAEEERISRLTSEALSSFKNGSNGHDQFNEELGGDEEGQEGTTEERSDPEGKETTPEGTDEAPRSPVAPSPTPEKEVGIEDQEIHEPLTA
ncbi:uncharacterized protein Rsph3 [Penaeus vannamei]|uniref:uncharacterized protein Rsph3 n=1 Tax=Penaeus vannamei TaxID=6689 RepID=UPI00387F725E